MKCRSLYFSSFYVQDALNGISISFVDESDPDFELKELLKEVQEKSAQGHWKSATRKLKKLNRRFPEFIVPESTYIEALEACMANRLHGARASEPARKIMEQMVEQGYVIPEQAGNYCIRNSIGAERDSTHQGFGGVDTALAMMSALKLSGTPIQVETFDSLCKGLAREGSVDHAIKKLRTLVIDRCEKPPMETFAAIAKAAIADPSKKQEEMVLTVLGYTKGAGYDQEQMAATKPGRDVLAAGIIAADRLDNDALGFRLLTLASRAFDEEDETQRGDILIAKSSSAARSASYKLHKRAIIKAVDSRQWKLAVKILELMLERGLRPSAWIWRNVVTCCAKAEKSRKATALLKDWLSLAQEGKAEKPPLSVFNTVINACEICDEEDLTLVVLDAMKDTHNTEGNIITFNIALKRLAKKGNYAACEGMIVGMLQGGYEPTVVSYTTAIAACVSNENKNPQLAYEWMKRMRARNVAPNVLTFNTALAACLDGKLSSTQLASKIAEEMIQAVDKQLMQDSETFDDFTDVVPNSSTKFIARSLMRQLKENWIAGDIEKRVATDTLRVSLLKLVDFQKSEAAERARKLAAERKSVDEDQATATSQDEIELEYSTAASTHRVAEV